MSGETLTVTQRLDMMKRDVRCPECRLNWWLHPPAKIHDSDQVRCVECKSVYPLATLTPENSNDR